MKLLYSMGGTETRRKGNFVIKRVKQKKDCNMLFVKGKNIQYTQNYNPPLCSGGPAYTYWCTDPIFSSAIA